MFAAVEKECENTNTSTQESCSVNTWNHRAETVHGALLDLSTLISRPYQLSEMKGLQFCRTVFQMFLPMYTRSEQLTILHYNRLLKHGHSHQPVNGERRINFPLPLQYFMV